MLVEQIIFTIISLALFVAIFVKMIKNNDTTYVVVLVLAAIGILINFIEVISGIKLAIFFKILEYLLSVVIPVAILAMEKRGVKFLETKNILKARIFIAFGNYKAAKDALIAVASKYPNSYMAHKMLAEVYEKEGGMRKAIDEYVQAIDINKRDYDSYYKIANLLTQLDKKDEAQEMLNNLLQKKPEYYQATELLGDILIEKGLYKDAVSVYIEGLKYNPTNYNLNYSLGIAYTMLNDFQSAKLYYEKAAELNSLAYNSKYSLAEIALIYKELEEAEKKFLEVLEEENGELEADAYFELAKISMIKGEKDKAINYANIAIEVDSKKIVPKIKEDLIFIPILAKINMPLNLDDTELEEVQEKEEQTKMSKKEINAKIHLEEMAEKTRNLSYSDINFLKGNRKNKKDNLQKQEEFERKERE